MDDDEVFTSGFRVSLVRSICIVDLFLSDQRWRCPSSATAAHASIDVYLFVLRRPPGSRGTRPYHGTKCTKPFVFPRLHAARESCKVVDYWFETKWRVVSTASIDVFGSKRVREMTLPRPLELGGKWESHHSLLDDLPKATVSSDLFQEESRTGRLYK